MVALRKRVPDRMTLMAFLDWNPEGAQGRQWQLIDGEPVAMAPGSETHAALQGEIGRLTGNHLIERGSACRLLSQPGIVPRVHANRNFRIPDLAVTCAPPGTGLIVAESVVLIEILSPSNEAVTCTNIWTYTTIPSVREILAVHSTRVEAELLCRNVDGSWPEDPATLTGADLLTLNSIDFTTRLAALYRTTALG